MSAYRLHIYLGKHYISLGDEKKGKMALSSVEKYLIDEDMGTMASHTPAFTLVGVQL